MKGRFPQNACLFLLANTVKIRGEIIASWMHFLHMQTHTDLPKVYWYLCKTVCLWNESMSFASETLFFSGEEQFLFMFYCANKQITHLNQHHWSQWILCVLGGGRIRVHGSMWELWTILLKWSKNIKVLEDL